MNAPTQLTISLPDNGSCQDWQESRGHKKVPEGWPVCPKVRHGWMVPVNDGGEVAVAQQVSCSNQEFGETYSGRSGSIPAGSTE